jgi:hypothetical protein
MTPDRLMIDSRGHTRQQFEIALRAPLGNFFFFVLFFEENWKQLRAAVHKK